MEDISLVVEATLFIIEVAVLTADIIAPSSINI